MLCPFSEVSCLFTDVSLSELHDAIYGRVYYIPSDSITAGICW